MTSSEGHDRTAAAFWSSESQTSQHLIHAVLTVDLSYRENLFSSSSLKIRKDCAYPQLYLGLHSLICHVHLASFCHFCKYQILAGNIFSQLGVCCEHSLLPSLLWPPSASIHFASPLLSHGIGPLLMVTSWLCRRHGWYAAARGRLPSARPCMRLYSVKVEHHFICLSVTLLGCDCLPVCTQSLQREHNSGLLSPVYPSQAPPLIRDHSSPDGVGHERQWQPRQSVVNVCI